MLLPAHPYLLFLLKYCLFLERTILLFLAMALAVLSTITLFTYVLLMLHTVFLHSHHTATVRSILFTLFIL